MSKYEVVKGGEAIVLPYIQSLKTKGAVASLSCCDCGLVHTVVIVPLKTRAKLYLWRDNRATANVRRSKKFRGKLK